MLPPAAGAQTLLVVSGNGNRESATFTAPGDWRIDYAAFCPNVMMRGVLTLILHTPDRGFVSAPLTVYPTNKDEGSAPVHGVSGPIYIEILTTDCSWAIAARA